MISVFDQASTNWTGNGLSILKPISCTVREIAGGEYELEMVHPITNDMRWTELVTGNIIKAPVPYKAMPYVASGVIQLQSGAIVWKTTVDTDIYLDDTGSTVIGHIPASTEYVYLGGVDGTWHIGWYGNVARGYIHNTDAEYVRTETTQPGKYGSTFKLPQSNYQCFRIYSSEVDTQNGIVTVNAWHLSYDNANNLVGNVKIEDKTGVQAAKIISNARGLNYGTITSDITSTYSADIAFKSVIQCLLDPEIGMAQKLRGRVVRDNRDIYVLKNTDVDSGYTICHGKNLLGVTWTKRDEDVITRILPTGQDKDGNVITLPEIVIDSQYINNYPIVRMSHLEVSDAKQSDDKPLSECYRLMREAAREEFSKGCDLIDFELDVDFLRLGDSEEYKQYRGLEVLSLYDLVTIVHGPTGLKVKAQIAEYEWDAILERYNSIRVGSVFAVEGATISGYMLSSGSVGGTKLTPGAVGPLQLRDLAVSHAKIDYAAVHTANIQQAAITTACIQDLAVTTEKVGESTITSAKIANAAIETAKIADAAVTSAKIANAAISNGHLADATITEAKILDGSITHAKIADAAVETANIADAAITSAKIGTAAVTDGKIDNLAVGTANLKNASVTNLKIADAAVSTAKIADLSVTNAKIANGDINKAKIKDFEAEVAAISTATIQSADISFAQIKDLTADVALIERSVEGKTYIRDLAVTDANIVQLLASKLVIADADGNWHQLIVDTATGNVLTSLIEIDGGTLLDGTVDHMAIVRNSITTRELNVAELMADEAFINQLTAGLARFGTVFGNSALIEQLRTHLIASDYLSIKVRNDLAWSNGTNLIRGASTSDKTVSVLTEIQGEEGEEPEYVHYIDIGSQIAIDDEDTDTGGKATFKVWIACDADSTEQEGDETYIQVAAAIDVVVTNYTAELGEMILGTAVLGAESASGYTVYGNAIRAGSSGWSTATVNLPDGVTAIQPRIAQTTKTGTTAQISYNSEKCEFGEIATPWTACPFDLEGRVTETELAIEPETITATVLSTDTYKSEENRLMELSSSASLTIVDNAIRSCVKEQDYKEDQSALTSWQSTYEQKAEGFTQSIPSLQGDNDLVNTYMSFGAQADLDNRTGVLIGKSNTNLRMMLDNEKMSFYNGTNELSYFSGDSMYIKNARITNTLSIGTAAQGWFDWVRVAGGLGLKYREPTT